MARSSMGKPRPLFMAIFFVSIVALSAMHLNHFVSDVRAKESNTLGFIDLEKNFSPDASLDGVYGGYAQIGTRNGVPFSIYKDGSASFGTEGAKYGEAWSARCKSNAMTDERSCLLLKDDLAVAYYEKSGWFLVVGGGHYPGTSVAIRLDKAKPLTAGPNGWSGKAALDLIQKISNAKTVTTRYQKWPYRSDIDVEMDTFGFQVATEYLRWAVKKQK